jgi:hypothetical protein
MPRWATYAAPVAVIALSLIISVTVTSG